MPAQKLTKFVWTAAKQQAAMLLAEDALSDEAIAAAVGMSRRQLAVWKLHPDFQTKITEYVATLEAAALKHPIARRRERVAALQRRWAKLEQVVTERAADPTMHDVPGGTTGLMVRQLKSIGFGENNQTVEEYVIDGGLLKEMRAHEEQAAKELGQWSEKVEHSAEVTIRRYIGVQVELV